MLIHLVPNCWFGICIIQLQEKSVFFSVTEIPQSNFSAMPHVLVRKDSNWNVFGKTVSLGFRSWGICEPPIFLMLI